MTPAQWDYLKTYVRQCADLFGLKDWRLELSQDPTDAQSAEHSNATVHVWEDKHGATLWFKPTFPTERTPEDQRQTVCHELLHCHLDGTCDMVYRDLKEHLAPAALSVFCAGYGRYEETQIDSIARVVAVVLPLPEWPKEQAETVAVERNGHAPVSAIEVVV